MRRNVLEMVSSSDESGSSSNCGVSRSEAERPRIVKALLCSRWVVRAFIPSTVPSMMGMNNVAGDPEMYAMFSVVFAVAEDMFPRLVCFSARAAFVFLGVEASAKLTRVCVACSVLYESAECLSRCVEDLQMSTSCDHH